MLIVIENSGYYLDNLGDVSMLQVATRRLKNLWPNATIKVLTNSGDKLTHFCPNTYPLSPRGRQVWASPLASRVYKVIPSKAAQYIADLECQLRKYSPSLASSILKLKFKLKRRTESATYFQEFMEAINGADLVVATGGGYVTDVFEEGVLSNLDTLILATSLGKPTVMLGQGLGPFWNQKSLTKLKAVFPLLDLVALREERVGLPFLKSLGISQDRILVTGDDAIELAYEAHTRELGNGIGVNLRASKYSGVNQGIFETVQLALQGAAMRRDVPLVAVPISCSSYKGYEDSDSLTIQKLLKGYDDTSDGGQYLDTPLKVIEQVRHCRVVVTGSYHAGVFALAQGVPVIGLAKSQYYLDKFLGLADQFGSGCDVILLDNDRQLREKLEASILKAWEEAEQLRPQLLESARRQIEMGYAAYQRVYELVQSR